MLRGRGRRDLPGGWFKGEFAVSAVFILTWALPARAQQGPEGLDLLANGGFEQVQDGQLVGWSVEDGGLTTLSDERAHTGRRALKIADPSEQDGSSAVSERKPVRPGRKYAVRLWSYLAQGKPGLGVYLRFWDAEGNELAEARERSLHSATMREGVWVPTFFVVTPPPQAREVAVWLHTFSTAVLTCYVDDVSLLEAKHSFEELEQWGGGTLEERMVKEGRYSVRWAHAESTYLGCSFDPPADWSKFNALSFWLYSEKATGSAFMLIISSENPEVEGMDYYAFRIVLDWTGWRKFLLPFRELSVARQPLGWHHIDRVYFTASGWGNEPNPEVIVYMDGFETTQIAERGPRLTDEEFFAALDLDRPELRAVRAAVAAANWPAARRELAKHLRTRRRPRWFFDWRDHPFRGVQVPTEDRAPEQWDYFSRYLTLDWEGWKHFRLKKEDFSPRAFVEGEGWKEKKPIGWHWIRYLAFNAKGWGLTPDPEVVLYFDDVRLVGREKSVTISDFEEEPLRWEGLERSAEQAKRGQFSGKWADQVTTGGIRCWNIPHDWTEFEALEFWAYCTKATGSRIILVLDSDVPKTFKEADDLLQLKFGYGFAGAGRFEIQFKDRIDWTANPTKGEARTHLWNEALNRHFHFRTLAEAYWQSGLEKYAAGLVAQWLDWIESNPPPLLSSGNRVPWPYGCYAWQTLTTGIRLESTWPNALYRCLGSPAFTDEALVMILKSICEQARHLVRWPTGGNWLTEESMGLFTAGMLFPEFKEAKQWRQTALERLYRQLDEEVYPDGMEYELAAGYNNWVVSNLSRILDLAELNDLQAELPPDYLAKLEKMYNYLLYASMPNRAIPGLNDAGNADVKSLLRRGYELFPQREDFLYVATDGKRGQVPRQTSYAFPYSGHYVMRSGWGAKAVYLLFDSGPFGYGHQHEDKLHFVLYAYGKQHLLDPGNYSYDASKWRRYVLTTPGHNTVMVDGQGQNRRAKRETYIWPKPWDKPVPPGNDTRWESTEEYDYAVGTYRDGYGPNNDQSVTHTRRILFVKPEYFLLLDTLTATDEKTHRYESLFHLDTAEARVDEGSLSVRTKNAEASNLLIVPLAGEGLQVRLVSGQEEPVQGWANHPWRAVPTAIYTKEGQGVTRLLHVLYPLRPGQAEVVASVEPLPLRGADGTPAEGLAAKITFTDGRVHYFAQSDVPGREVRFGEFTTRGEVMLVRTGADGKVNSVLQIVGASP